MRDSASLLEGSWQTIGVVANRHHLIREGTLLNWHES
jgi:hypothetical protein